MKRIAMAAASVAAVWCMGGEAAAEWSPAEFGVGEAMWIASPVAGGSGGETARLEWSNERSWREDLAFNVEDDPVAAATLGALGMPLVLAPWGDLVGEFLFPQVSEGTRVALTGLSEREPEGEERWEQHRELGHLDNYDEGTPFSVTVSLVNWQF